MAAEKGGSLNFDPDDEFQKKLIHALSEVGGKKAGTNQNTVISVVSNENKKTSIPIGAKSFQTFSESNKTFDSLMEDAAGNNLFDSGALDAIKRQTKRGIK